MLTPVKVVLTIDTEGDAAWTQKDKVTVDNLRALPRFQAMCDRYGLKPTYLCTYEVVRAEGFAPLIEWQRAGRCEIGSHLHPWTNPPFTRADAGDMDRSEYPGYPSELTADRFGEKLRVLGDLITSRTGRAPTSYRAGRWGFSEEQIPVLLELGYIVDTSVTPLIDRSHDKGVRDHGPDFRRAPVAPYRLAANDICAEGDSRLWEVPVTIVHVSDAMQKSATARWAWSKVRGGRGSGLLNRAFTLEPQWFRPYPWMDAGKLMRVYRQARTLGLPVVDMMFHSSELYPGASTSFPDAASIERVFATLDATFARLQGDGCEGVTLSDFVREDLGVSATG
jgi:hypothetical protein